MKLLLAGMENSLDMAIKHGVKDILVSALYMSKKRGNMEIVLSNFDFVFLDSGAFTFWNKWSQIWEKAITEHYGADKVTNIEWQKEVWLKTPLRKQLWEAHWQWGVEWENEYLAMLKSDVRFANRDIVHVVEFDVGDEEQMTERRKRFEAEGFHVIPVFHPDDSEDYKRMLIREYDYIGIGGLAVDTGRKFYAQQFSKYFLELRKYQTKVHGFGMTQQEPMRRMPFYSVDSTSWLSGSRYGTTYEFRNGQLKTHVDKGVRKRFKRQCEELGISYEGLLADDNRVVNEWNMLQWKMYAEWLTGSPMKKKQEYWHDRENGGELRKVVKENEQGEREVIILNSLGEEYKPPQIAEDSEGEETTDIAIVEESQAPTVAVSKADLVAKGLYMECDSCTLGDRCPLYREGKLCQIPATEVKGPQDFEGIMRFLFSLQQKRILLASMQESSDGGILDERLSKEMDRMMSMMQRFKDMVNPQDELVIKAKGNPSGGILQKIFGIGGQENL